MVPTCLHTQNWLDRVGRQENTCYILIDPHGSTERAFLHFCGR